METFKHNFKTAFGVLDIQGVVGYTKALQEVYNYLAKVTEFNPAKRHIDAVPLLDLIGNTNAELSQLMSEEQDNLTATETDLLLQEKLS